jgi:uncharacterized damage-inducible protein DinB
MSEVTRILDQLKRAFEGEAWHGPSVNEVLAGVTAAIAAEHPIRGAHSIWEIVLHVATWERAVRRRLEGDPAAVPDEEDWQLVTDTKEEAWQDALSALTSGHLALRKAIAALTDADLDKAATGQFYTVYFMLHGAIQHDLYHAGQISLLKKA